MCGIFALNRDALHKNLPRAMMRGIWGGGASLQAVAEVEFVVPLDGVARLRLRYSHLAKAPYVISADL